MEARLASAFERLASEKYELQVMFAVAAESIIVNLEAAVAKENALARSWNERAQTAKANWNPTLAKDCLAKETHHLKISDQQIPILLSQIELNSRFFANVHFSNVHEHQLLIIKDICSILTDKSNTPELLLQLTNDLAATYKMPKSRFKLPLDFESKLEALSLRISELEQTAFNEAIAIRNSNPDIAIRLEAAAQTHIERTENAISNINHSVVKTERKPDDDYNRAATVERHMLAIEKKQVPFCLEPFLC